MTEVTSDKQERYVDDLAGPDDCWLSITDAARATRRQDITIRRWIARGQLPVRRQNVGINQRTRQVRTSDLSKLTPIVDPTAGITSERGQVDLVSIPTQQAAIKAAYEELLGQVADLHRQLDQRFEAMQTVFAEQKAQHQRDVDTLQVNFTAKLTEIERGVELQHQQHESLVALINDQQHQLDQLRDQVTEQTARLGDRLEQQRSDVARQLTEQHERLESELVTVRQAALAEQEQRREALARLESQQSEALARHREALDTVLAERQREVEQLRQVFQEHADRHSLALQAHRRQIEALLSQRSRDVDDALQGLNKEVAAALSGLTQQVEQIGKELDRLDTSIEVVKIAALGSQHRADKQDEQIAELRAQLLEAQQERSALAQQVAALRAEIVDQPRSRPRRKQAEHLPPA